MCPDSEPGPLNRRQFLARSAKASACAALACSAGFGFYTDMTPAGGPSEAGTVHLPDFSIKGSAPRMCIAAGRNREKTLRKAMDALGGMAAFIDKGDRVLLKVNAAFASPPALSATTHPELVAAAVALCLSAGAASVTVTDNPINDPASCFKLSGIGPSARRAGAEVMVPVNRWFAPVTVPDGKLIRNWPVLYEPLRKADKLIGIAPVKDHHRSGASMTLKNWYGLLGGRRNVFHQDVHNVIKELAMMVKPSLVILDGITPMVHNGPTGGSLSDLERGDTLIVSTDPVAADAFGAGLLGRQLRELPYIRKAEQVGAGTSDWHSLEPVFA